MIKVEVLSIGALETNCYIVSSGTKGLIIDPSDEADFIFRKLNDLEIEPVLILATHGHFDHLLAASELVLGYKIPFLMHKSDEFLLERMQSSAKHFTGQNVLPPPKINKYLSKKTRIDLNGSPLEIIETPGHTPGGVSFYSKGNNLLFAGDLVFKGGLVGRSDFKYSDEEKLKKSITRILKLPGTTNVYPGHGEKTTISDLRKILDT